MPDAQRTALAARKGGVGDGVTAASSWRREAALTHAIEIDAAGDQLAHRAHALRVAEFVIRHQTQVALGQSARRASCTAPSTGTSV